MKTPRKFIKLSRAVVPGYSREPGTKKDVFVVRVCVHCPCLKKTINALVLVELYYNTTTVNFIYITLVSTQYK